MSNANIPRKEHRRANKQGARAVKPHVRKGRGLLRFGGEWDDETAKTTAKLYKMQLIELGNY